MTDGTSPNQIVEDITEDIIAGFDKDAAAADVRALANDLVTAHIAEDWGRMLELITTSRHPKTTCLVLAGIATWAIDLLAEFVPRDLTAAEIWAKWLEETVELDKTAPLYR